MYNPEEEKKKKNTNTQAQKQPTPSKKPHNFTVDTAATDTIPSIA